MDSNDLGFDDDFMATMMGDFLDESQIYLANLNDNLLVLDELVGQLQGEEDSQIDLELLNEMFRDAHSLKGLSAMLQLSDINRLTHNVENVFDAARDQTLSISSDVVELMFQAFDRLATMVENLKSPSDEEIEYQSIVDEIQEILKNAGLDRKQGSNSEVDKVLEAAIEEQASSPADETADRPATCDDPLAGIEDEEEISSKYLSIFIGETEESLDLLSEQLLADGEIEVDPLLVNCHRIKGSAASIGLKRSAKLAHLMEDLLQDLRDTNQSITSEISDALLAAVDSLREFVEQLKSGNPTCDSFSQAYKSLSAVQEVQGAGSKISEDELAEIKASLPSGVQAAVGVVLFEEHLPLVEIKARMIFDRLDSSEDLLFRSHEDQQLEKSQGLSRILFAVITELSCDELRNVVNVDGVQDAHIEVIQTEVATKPTSTNAQKSAEQATKEEIKNETSPNTPDSSKQVNAVTPKKNTPAPETDSTSGKNKPTETLRVEIERLDHLMNLAGQLVINKARFGQIGEQLKDVSSRKQSSQCIQNISCGFSRMLSDASELAGNSPESDSIVQGIQSCVQQVQRDLEVIQNDMAKLYQTRNLVNDLSEAVHQLDRVSDGIQKSVMDIRMVPIGPLFGRFKRVIRDITRSNGKDINLIIRGDKTELDKRMIDELGDPLIHMVRNSADHGIESPEDREAAGKPRQGTVTLDAFHRGNRIFIEVRDDGKGLDPEKLRQKAIQKGIISAADAERLTTQQSLQLIWEPGFSTAEKVTEVSGRGMGMDIVRSKIEHISGTLELDSKVGVGTTITIKLPLTMAILPSLLTVIDEDVFAIPMESVSEIVSIGASDITTIHGMKTATVRGRAISVVDLGGLFNWNVGSTEKHSTNDEHTLVIIGSDGNELGLAVDDLLGEEDIVIKSLAENYKNVNGIAGASILGDGRVSLILDVAALIDIACRKQSSSSNGSATNTNQVLVKSE